MIMIKCAAALLFQTILFLTMASHTCAQTVLISQNVGIDQAPPYTWFDQIQNEQVGVIPYLQERIFREIGFELQRVPFDLNSEQDRHQLFRMLALGDIDVIGSTARLPRIARIADYVEEPMFEVVVRVYVLSADPFPYAGWSSLQGKKGVTVGKYTSSNFAFFSELADYAERHFILTDVATHEQAVKLLLDHKADYWVDTDTVAESLILSMKRTGKIRGIETPLASVPVYMAVSKQSRYQDLAAELGRRLQSLRKSGEYEQIERRYVQRYMTYYETASQVAHEPAPSSVNLQEVSPQIGLK